VSSSSDNGVGVALVTGASRGLGRAIALGLGRAGFDVAVGYRTNEDAAKHVVDELGASGRRSFAIAGDVGDTATSERLVAATVERLGRLDVLVANAGAAAFVPFLETDAETFDVQQRTNARGAFLLARVAAQRMIEQGEGGRIIFVTSEAADLPTSGLTAYCASRAAQKMVMQCAAVELAQFGITVNAVAPGTIETDGNRHLLADPEHRQMLLAGALLDHEGTPDDIAGAAVYLAGAAHVTGCTISVNAGTVML
jgi:NAD(P)-dependent dehydrogenase (short-subunit alcohol dehydrogenase family)